jgi:hypothetical protein
MSSAAMRGHICMRIILGDLISPTALPDAQLAVLAGTGHIGIDTRIVIDFLTAPREVDR